MLSELSKYHVPKSPLRHVKTSYNGEECSYEYKINTAKKIKYIVKIDFFYNNIGVVKFFPKKHASNPNKYKIRINKGLTLFIEILSKCINICLDLHKKDPDLSFLFFGQWDSKDVSKNNIESQRFRIYRRIVLSLFSADNFIFAPSESNQENKYNYLLILPKHREDELEKLISIINENYINHFEEMIIPQS